MEGCFRIADYSYNLSFLNYIIIGYDYTNLKQVLWEYNNNLPKDYPVINFLNFLFNCSTSSYLIKYLDFIITGQIILNLLDF